MDMEGIAAMPSQLGPVAGLWEDFSEMPLS